MSLQSVCVKDKIVGANIPVYNLEVLPERIQRHCVPLFFWRNSDQEPRTFGASASLIRIGPKGLFITCEHVWKRFESFKQEYADAVLGAFLGAGFGLYALTGIALLDRSESLDVAVLHFPEIAWMEDFEDKLFYTVSSLPIAAPNCGEHAIILGYPEEGDARSFDGKTLTMGYTFGLVTVSSVSEHGFGMAPERRWINVTNGKSEDAGDADVSSGMSGGPCFVIRETRLDFVGVVRAGRSSGPIFAAAAWHLDVDGKLQHSRIPPRQKFYPDYSVDASP